MTKKVISRGFHGRRQQSDLTARLSPGQYLENGFPVLSAGPTPHTPTDTWNFSIWEGGHERKRWTWDEFQAMPHEEVTADIHCVTKWSKLDTHWKGVSVDRVLEGLDRYDRELRRPFRSEPQFAPESKVWRPEHAIADAAKPAGPGRDEVRPVTASRPQSMVSGEPS